MCFQCMCFLTQQLTDISVSLRRWCTNQTVNWRHFWVNLKQTNKYKPVCQENFLCLLVVLVKGEFSSLRPSSDVFLFVRESGTFKGTAVWKLAPLCMSVSDLAAIILNSDGSYRTSAHPYRWTLHSSAAHKSMPVIHKDPRKVGQSDAYTFYVLLSGLRMMGCLQFVKYSQFWLKYNDV